MLPSITLNKWTIGFTVVILFIGYIFYLKIRVSLAFSEVKKVEHKIQKQNLTHFEEIQEIKIKEPHAQIKIINTDVGVHTITGL